eukprot:s4584_g6.t1
MADGTTNMEDDDSSGSPKAEPPTDEEEEMDPSVPFPHGAQLLPKPPPAAWMAKQLHPAPPPPKNQGDAAPENPGNAKSWPPVIDAKAGRPIEQTRMAAEDPQMIQQYMALQAKMMAPKTTPKQQSQPPHKPKPPAKISSPAPKQTGPPPKNPGQLVKQQDPAAAKNQPEFAAAQLKSSIWKQQIQKAILQPPPKQPSKTKQASTQLPHHPVLPAGYSDSETRMPLQPLEPRPHPAGSPPCKTQPQSPPKAKGPVQSHSPGPTSSSTVSQPSSSAAKAATSSAAKAEPSSATKAAPSSEANQPTIPRSTDWKHKLAFFARYWLARNYEVTTNAIAQFAADLQMADQNYEGTHAKVANPIKRTWQDNAYSLVHHYNRENWSAINNMVYRWRHDGQFANLVDRATSIGKAHPRDRRMPDWWGH